MKIKELLNRPERWTRKAFARAKNDEIVHYNSEDAVSFCLFGAMKVCYPDDVGAVRNKLSEVVGPIIDWNDARTRTFEEVQELVERLDV